MLCHISNYSFVSVSSVPREHHMKLRGKQHINLNIFVGVYTFGLTAYKTQDAVLKLGEINFDGT